MIKLFEIENKVVKPTEHCQVIKWLKVIQEVFPDNFMDVYAYIFYMANPSQMNPYYNVPFDSREDTILEDLVSEIDTEADEIIEAVEKARVLYKTPTVRAYENISVMLDNIGDYIRTATVTVGRDGNLTSLIRVGKEYDALRQSFKGVAKDLDAEQESHVRGGQDLGYDQVE